MRKYFTNLNLSSSLFGQCTARGLCSWGHNPNGDNEIPAERTFLKITVINHEDNVKIKNNHASAIKFF
jgi:hypothetical protein